jgi:hypothetical protein
MTRTQKTKIPSNEKCLIFLYFQYNKNEDAWIENKLDIETLLCIERDNSSRIPSNKTPIPMYKDNQNENMMRKTPPRNSNKDRFLVIPQALNRHYKDPRRINKHQIPPNNHQT